MGEAIYRDMIGPEEIARMIDTMNSGFLITDADGLVLYVNDAYRRLTKLHGLKVGESILRYKVLGLIKGEPACIAVARERRKIIRKFVQTEDGVFIVSSSEPVLEQDGEVRLVLTRVHDMTEFIGIRDDIEKVRTIMETMAQNTGRLKDYGENVIALSSQMTHVLDIAGKVAGFDLSVLMTGESGTGKDVVARYIHEQSPRSRSPFVAVNCAAIPAELLEAELFGYDKGTFTGQKAGGKKGLFAAAADGTLFLDEIGDMPLGLQAKILRVLEARQFRPLGSNTPVEMKARVLSATNHDLKRMIAEGTFREDLYYRINVVELRLPPLRERREDIVPLTLFFLKKNNEKYNLDKTISVVELQKLQSYDWPGNVRELKNTVEMMYALSSGRLLEAPMGTRPDQSYSVMENDFNDFLMTATGSWIVPDSGRPVPVTGTDTAEAAPEHADAGEDFTGLQEEEHLATLESFMDQREKAYLEHAYHICGTTRRMAEILGVNHSTIMRKLKKYGITAK